MTLSGRANSLRGPVASRTEAMSSSRSIGLARKLTAPSRMAVTALRMSAKAVTSSTGRAGCVCRTRRSISRPDMPGIRTSLIIIANAPSAKSCKAASPDAAL